MKLSEEMRNYDGMHFPYREYADKVAQLEVENAALKREIEISLELLEEGRDLILRMRSKLGEVGMWETILGRMDALLTEQEQANE